MYIKVLTEDANSDGKQYAIGWGTSDTNIVRQPDNNTYFFHTKFVYPDFFKNVRKWYVKNNELRCNPNRDLN